MKIQIKNDVSLAESTTQWDKTVDQVKNTNNPTDMDDVKAMEPGAKLSIYWKKKS
jgi:hypothetical protein